MQALHAPSVNRLGIVLGAIVVTGVMAAGVLSLRARWQAQAIRENTFYSERYSGASFARIKTDMPRAAVIEILGQPFNAVATSLYPVEALRHESMRKRYAKASEISVEYDTFSAPKSSQHDFHQVSVSFGPEGTVIETSDSLADSTSP